MGQGVHRSGAESDQGDARGRILDSAETLFARHGFDATPTARIATEAGVPKGLLFYYFPTKLELLRTLLAERLPTSPLCSLTGIVRRGDVPGSLVRLGRKLGLGVHPSAVLRTIIFREAETHPEVGAHIQSLRAGLVELTETVLDSASDAVLDPVARTQAAQTYIAVMFDEANSRRFTGKPADLHGAARIVAAGLCAASTSVSPSTSDPT